MPQALPEIHPIIAMFQEQSEALDAAQDTSRLDDAIALLAGWMELSQSRLTDADMTVLVDIGGILFREDLKRKMN